MPDRPNATFTPRLPVKVAIHGVAEGGREAVASFAEVIGLVVETRPVRPGRWDKKLLLRRGIADQAFMDWLQYGLSGTTEPRSCTILFVDRALVSRWSVSDVRPTKYVGGSFNASSSEYAIESLELSYEGLVRE